MLLAIAPSLATLKFIKLLRYNKTVLLLSKAISVSMKTLLGVIFIFLVVFFTFVQAFYLSMNDRVSDFRTVLMACTTSFQILLGKFDINKILIANPILGAILYLSFNLAVLMIVLNLIITTISDTFSNIKSNFFY